MRASHRRTSRPHALPDARGLAWELLQLVEQGAYADALLGHRLGGSGLATRDQALVTRLVYGTLAWQGYLDHIIAAFSRRPPDTLDPPVRTILRLALFQTCVLTRIPDFAAVNTAVNLVKRFRGGAAVSLVNAVLRRAAVGWQQVEFPSREHDPIAHLSGRLSHPRWLVERWVTDYGVDETEALLEANNEAAPTVARLNRRKTDRAGLVARLAGAGYDATPTPYSPTGIQLEPGGTPGSIPGYSDGLLSVQGEASQLIAFLVAPQPGDRVLDACAGAGGKTTHLAELMDDRGSIVALDPHAAGIHRLQQAAHRLGLSIIRTDTADATTWNDSGQGFDAVLVDAPCSGLGTLRAHPEVRWRRTTVDVATLARLQLQLLLRLSEHVRPGGTLVYATCTLTQDENDAVLATFLRERPAFAVDDPRRLLPETVRPLIGTDHVLRTLPHRHSLDGFFAVRLKRRGEHDIVRE